MTAEETRRCLARLPAAAGLDPDEVATLASVLTPRRLLAGDVLFAEGDHANGCYFLGTGKLEVERHVGDQTVRYATLGPGALVGELALLDRGRRSARVRAVADTWVLQLLRSDFDRVFKARHRFAYALLDTVLDGLASRLRATTGQLAAIASDPDEDPLGATLQRAADSAGAALTSQPERPAARFAFDLTALEPV